MESRVEIYLRKPGIEKVSLEFAFHLRKPKMLARNPVFTLGIAQFSAAFAVSRWQLPKLFGKSVLRAGNLDWRSGILFFRPETADADEKTVFPRSFQECRSTIHIS